MDALGAAGGWTRRRLGRHGRERAWGSAISARGITELARAAGTAPDQPPVGGDAVRRRRRAPSRRAPPPRPRRSPLPPLPAGLDQVPGAVGGRRLAGLASGGAAGSRAAVARGRADPGAGRRLGGGAVRAGRRVAPRRRRRWPARRSGAAPSRGGPRCSSSCGLPGRSPSAPSTSEGGRGSAGWWRPRAGRRAPLRRPSSSALDGARERAGVAAEVALRLSPEIDGPGVWGLRRPVLLLPDGIAEHLAPAELEAVLLHELEHVRRRDNLFGLFQTALRCLYWFHPLVWWLERRMLAERERACDDRVVALGAAPRLYAKSLLKVVALRPRRADGGGLRRGRRRPPPAYRVPHRRPPAGPPRHPAPGGGRGGCVGPPVPLGGGGRPGRRATSPASAPPTRPSSTPATTRRRRWTGWRTPRCSRRPRRPRPASARPAGRRERARASRPDRSPLPSPQRALRRLAAGLTMGPSNS